MLEFKDEIYFNECVGDSISMLVPIEIRRAIKTKRSDSNYPDSHFVTERHSIFTSADIRTTPLSEVAKSGGLLIAGDNTIWCSVKLHGPRSGKFDFEKSNELSDIIVFKKQEWVVIGFPDQGTLIDDQFIGNQAYIRKRRSSYG